MTVTPTTTLGEELLEQLTFHWEGYIRPKLEGLTDEEYLWEPAPGMWSVRPRGESSAPVQGGSGAFVVEFAYPEPEPPPATTIAWRLGHITVGCLAMRNAAHFGHPPADYLSWDYAGDAATALAQLDEQYDRWVAGVRAKSDDDLWKPIGDAEPFPDAPFLGLVLHINREVIHHSAEVLVLRDLHRASGGKPVSS